MECESRAAESLDPLLSCSSADFRDAEEVGEAIEDSDNASLAEVVQRSEIAVEGCERDSRSSVSPPQVEGRCQSPAQGL